jgi:hypothetical protein
MDFMLDTSALNPILDGQVGNEWSLRGRNFVTDYHGLLFWGTRMSWEKLLADRAVTPLLATKQELDNLRSIVTRSLSDVTASGLSAVRALSSRTTRREPYH